MEQPYSPATRYRVEIESRTKHVECKGLTQVLALLDRQTGPVCVLDHLEPGRAFEGTVDEYRESLWSNGSRAGESPCNNRDLLPGS